MQVDTQPFPVNVHTIDLEGKEVLLRPDQAKSAEGKEVIIGEPRVVNVDNNILGREVTIEKAPDGKERLLITLKTPMPRGQVKSSG
jgi:hypothetical protein